MQPLGKVAQEWRSAQVINVAHMWWSNLRRTWRIGGIDVQYDAGDSSLSGLIDALSYGWSQDINERPARRIANDPPTILPYTKRFGSAESRWSLRPVLPGDTINIPLSRVEDKTVTSKAGWCSSAKSVVVAAACKRLDSAKGTCRQNKDYRFLWTYKVPK